MKTMYKILGVLCFVFAVFVLLLALLMFASGESGIGAFFAINCLFFAFLGRYLMKRSRKSQSQNARIQDSAPIGEDANIDITEKPQPTVKEEPIAQPEDAKSEIAQPEDAKSEITQPEDVKPEEAKSEDSEYEYYSFKVAGISFYQEDIIDSLAVENDDYDMTIKELADSYLINESVYKYLIPVSDVQLEDEPDNPHDPNAIKVLADGVHIGYVPSRSTNKVRQLLKKSPTVICDIYGGPSKIVFEDYNDDGEEVYTMKKSNHNIGAEVILKYCKAK